MISFQFFIEKSRTLDKTINGDVEQFEHVKNFQLHTFSCHLHRKL